MTTRTSDTYAFGAFRFNAAEGTLTRDGEQVPLTPKAADLLSAFIKSEGRLVTKDELLRQVWSSTNVEEGSLTFHVHLVRQALGDRTDVPQYIRTVPRRGYRFIATVRGVDEPSAALPYKEPGAAPESSSARPAPNRAGAAGAFLRTVKRFGPVAAIVAGTAVIGALLLEEGFFAAPPGSVRVTQVTWLTSDGLVKSGSEPLFTDGDHLIFHRPDGYRALTVGQAQDRKLTALNGFQILDISAARSEALARRPGDIGAQDALWAVPLAGGAPRRLGQILTTGWAAWSHDGKRIAFTRSNTLYLTDDEGATEERLRTFSGSLRDLAWAPGDRFIRFSLMSDADRVNRATLWDINADGTGLRKVFPDAAARYRECCGRWLDDVDYVFLTSDRSGRSRLLMLHSQTGLFRQHPPELIQISPDSLDLDAPLPSSDGRRIFALARRTAELAEYKIARGGFESFLPGIPAHSVSFSQDGVWLAYISAEDRTLWRARADGRERTQLTFAPLATEGFEWSPDARWIAFRGLYPGRHGKIYLVPASGGDVQALTDPDVEQGIPSWSADGSRIAYGDVPETYGHPRGGERIHIYDLSRRTSSIVKDSEGLWTSRWSPDGRSLAALTIQGQNLVLFDLATERWRPLGVTHVSEPIWSRDSRYLYCPPEGGETRVRRINVADGTIEPLVDLHEQPWSWVGVTPKGGLIISRMPMDLVALDLARR